MGDINLPDRRAVDGLKKNRGEKRDKDCISHAALQTHSVKL